MRHIREGLVEGVDVSVFAKPEFSSLKMHFLCTGMVEGFNMKKYIDFDEAQLKNVLEGLFEALEICKNKCKIDN